MNLCTQTPFVGPFASTRRRLHELFSAGTPIEVLLADIVEAVEQPCDGMLCSILLLETDGKHLRIGAAPHLPPAYNALFQDVAIGEGIGSCGTAAHRKQLVVAHDIGSDPLWANYKDLALPHGLRACWSMPVLSGTQVLGTFGCYYREPRSPNPDELQMVRAAADLVVEVIQQYRSSAPEKRLSPKTILVVDDNDIFRELVCDLLKTDGHQVLEAANSATALSVWGEHSDQIDVVLTDLDMPGMSGRDLALELERKRPEIKILLMSGNLNAAEADPRFLAKPFSIGDLRQKLRLLFG